MSSLYGGLTNELEETLRYLFDFTGYLRDGNHRLVKIAEGLYEVRYGGVETPGDTDLIRLYGQLAQVTYPTVRRDLHGEIRPVEAAYLGMVDRVGPGYFRLALGGGAYRRFLLDRVVAVEYIPRDAVKRGDLHWEWLEVAFRRGRRGYLEIRMNHVYGRHGFLVPLPGEQI